MQRINISRDSFRGRANTSLTLVIHVKLLFAIFVWIINVKEYHVFICIWRPKRDRCALTGGQLGGDWRTAKTEM